MHKFSILKHSGRVGRQSLTTTMATVVCATSSHTVVGGRGRCDDGGATACAHFFLLFFYCFFFLKQILFSYLLSFFLAFKVDVLTHDTHFFAQNVMNSGVERKNRQTGLILNDDALG